LNEAEAVVDLRKGEEGREGGREGGVFFGLVSRSRCREGGREGGSVVVASTRRLSNSL